ncbi:hypothetical protein CEXT_252621 [Caerostris extrusa]|uniref:Uncharacterized protein n=1 Tax=Caerostris extrusa TaxID=172846 RepID=A0AAV4MXS5_CAEEX|nr:hypothetical protein CEXT_252621 [Caerostris extrusa]
MRAKGNAQAANRNSKRRTENSLSLKRYYSLQQHLGQRTGIKRGGSNFLINSLIFTLSYFIGCASHLTDVHRTLTHLPTGIGPLRM